MNRYLKSIVVLTAICGVIAILLSATNFVTAPIIKQNENAAANKALLEVMPEGKEFTLVDISSYELPDTVTSVYEESSGGYVVQLTTAGYSTGLVIMCGVDKTGAVTGATCLASGETLGAEKTYGDKTVGKTIEDIDSVDTVASITRTTEAYRNAVKDALNTAIILGGGSVDLRSDEEILADNLDAALHAAGGKFTPWFMVEELEGVAAVYKADNGSGMVITYNGNFYGIDSAGSVLGEADEATKTLIADYAKKVNSSKVNSFSASSYELPAAILKTEKTASGNYVFEVKASGFGINGDSYYNPSGEPIIIKASVTRGGKIIACQTLSQKESEGYGSQCAEPEFYTQFSGKDETNYKEIDAISGATITTNGYVTAVGRVIEAVNIIEGRAK
ncbi:MAG: FMN-binding protein [Clostridia bacterium]|nr:FMN-binding protein [Clostridia bacterium]